MKDGLSGKVYLWLRKANQATPYLIFYQLTQIVQDSGDILKEF